MINRKLLIVDALTLSGVDLEKDYFSLTSEERAKVDEIRRAFHYYGKKPHPLTPLQQFYYSAQRAKRSI